ncbi:MAG: hypothetical protein JWP87_243 [Labilithrix sp.]|nr:hypothetical protein [Labilithrix sp.]
MADRVLSRRSRELLGVASCAIAALAIAGCPHDWSSFETVPTEEPSQGASPATPDAGPGGGAEGSAPSSGPVFATLPEKPTLIEADDEGIVMATTEGSVIACDHQSCASSRNIASGQHDVRGLALGGGFVAWAARGDNAVRRTSRSTPGPAEQANDDDGLVAVAVTATRVYFAVDAIDVLIGTPGIRSCRPGVDCTNITYAGFSDDRITELRFEGTDAFWLGEGTVVGCAIASCDDDVAKRVVLASEAVLPNALAVDADSVYYASAADGGSVRALSRLAVAGGAAAPRTLAKNVGVVTRFAVTRDSLWFTRSAAGTVSRVARSGGAVVDVATELRAPGGIARGGGYVYVACAGDGRVLRWKED